MRRTPSASCGATAGAVKARFFDAKLWEETARARGRITVMDDVWISGHLSIALMLKRMIGIPFDAPVHWRTRGSPNVLPIDSNCRGSGVANRAAATGDPRISVALGVCVDDTIHFFTKFMRARKRGPDAGQARRDVAVGVHRRAGVAADGGDDASPGALGTFSISGRFALCIKFLTHTCAAAARRAAGGRQAVPALLVVGDRGLQLDLALRSGA